MLSLPSLGHSRLALHSFSARPCCTRRLQVCEPSIAVTARATVASLVSWWYKWYRIGRRYSMKQRATGERMMLTSAVSPQRFTSSLFLKSRIEKRRAGGSRNRIVSGPSPKASSALDIWVAFTKKDMTMRGDGSYTTEALIPQKDDGGVVECSYATSRGRVAASLRRT